MTDLRGWKTCPRCANELEHGAVDGEDRDRLHCRQCSLVIYDNPAPTACALITEPGRLMLTRRAIEPSLGLWDLPGGYVEVDEHPEETLRREMLEETGLEIEISGLIGFFLDTYGDGGTDTLNVCFEAEITGGVAEAASDVAEIKWFELTEIPSDADLAFRNTREALAVWRETAAGA